MMINERILQYFRLSIVTFGLIHLATYNLAFSASSSSQTAISVHDNKIYLGTDPYAEIHYLPNQKNPSFFRGISIYYFQSGKEEWIFPKNGWDIENGGLVKSKTGTVPLSKIKQQWDGKIYGSKNTFVTLVCSDVQISSDGKKVTFLTYGIFSKSQKTYQIKYPKL